MISDDDDKGVDVGAEENDDDVAYTDCAGTYDCSGLLLLLLLLLLMLLLLFTDERCGLPTYPLPSIPATPPPLAKDKRSDGSAQRPGDTALYATADVFALPGAGERASDSRRLAASPARSACSMARSCARCWSRSSITAFCCRQRSVRCPCASATWSLMSMSMPFVAGGDAPPG